MRDTLPYSLAIVLLIGAACSAPAVTAEKPAEQEALTKLDKDPNLVGWWRFDEREGTTAADSSKHGRDGTLKGGLSFKDGSAPGRVGNALRFGEGEQYVEITGYKGVTGSQARTVAAWIKTRSPQGQVLSWGHEDFDRMFNLGFIEYIWQRIGVTGNGGRLIIGSRSDDDKWHHIVAVVDEADLPTFSDDVSVYMDGKLQEIHDYGILDMFPIDTGSGLDVRIGRGFTGLIDDVRIYDRALNEDEIEALVQLTPPADIAR